MQWHKAAVSDKAVNPKSTAAQKQKAGSGTTAKQKQGRQLPLKALVFGDCNLYAVWISIGVNAVAQGCCQLVWHSSTEGEGRQFTLKAAVVHWCLVTASLYAVWISIGVNAVAQSCCQLVWHSSTEEEGKQLT